MAVILLFGLKKEKEKAVRTVAQKLGANVTEVVLSLIHISEPTRQPATSRMPSSA